jgi:hypothetical protein
VCKRTIFTDSTDSFHMFLIEGGVGVFIPYLFPYSTPLASRKGGQAFLPLHFCNAVFVRTGARAMALEKRRMEPERFGVD